MENLSLGIIIAQLINFWIVFFIFYYFLWDKIVKIIEERRIKLDNLNNSDDIVKEKIEKAEELSKKIIDEARKKAQEIQKQAEELSKKEAQNRIEEASKKAQSILDSALDNIKKEEVNMIEWVKQKLLEVSLKINEKIFLDSSKNKEFIEKEVNSIKI